MTQVNQQHFYCLECADRLSPSYSNMVQVAGENNYVCGRHVTTRIRVFDSEYIRCADCARAVRAHSTASGVSLNHICRSGVSVDGQQCRSCNLLFTSGFEDGLCQRCLTGAVECWNYPRTSMTHRNRLVPIFAQYMARIAPASGDDDNAIICRDCLARGDFYTCDHCGAIVLHGVDCGCPGDEGFSDECECPLCEEDRNGRDDDDGYSYSPGDDKYLMHYYSHKPTLTFRGGVEPPEEGWWRGSRHDHNVYLGFELEVNTNGYRSPTEASRKATVDGFTVDGEPVVFLKEDSSIPEGGMEIVSHPATYEWWMESIQWTQAFSAMRAAGVSPHERCGMHVHVSKWGFSGPAHEHRWLLFWHRNSRELTTMARRESDRWSAFLPEYNSDRKAMKLIAQKQRLGRDRYQAINVTNDSTYEVRVFASTTNSIKFRAALGLVDASVEYCRGIRAKDVLHDGAWTWNAFRRWVEDPKQYAKYRWLNQEIIRLFGELSDEEADTYHLEGE